MSKPTTIPTALAQLAAERDRMSAELRRIADQLDGLSPKALAEVLVAVSAPVEELRRVASLWVKQSR
jgi:hypothetical protein